MALPSLSPMMAMKPFSPILNLGLNTFPPLASANDCCVAQSSQEKYTSTPWVLGFFMGCFTSAPLAPCMVMLPLSMRISMLGSGAVIVMDDSRCMVKSLQRLSYFYMHESCGQCTPCREGTGWLWRMVDRLERGEGRPSDMDLLDNVAENIMGRTICALGDAAAMPVRGMLKHFRAEFEHHITHKTCMVPAYV